MGLIAIAGAVLGVSDKSREAKKMFRLLGLLKIKLTKTITFGHRYK